ncbi:class I SAM-dependent methyltransferase [Glutamicibacter sp. AOP12-B1-11]|uniref:class I SAM-dependent methyltransferase n=1 Tax=Glutamicibacter sp. AOP12-B1-11 TaxID=3457725 RepID=UPI0040331F90
MTFESVRSSYGAKASQYVDAVGSIEHAAAADVAFVETWARSIKGTVLDVGCGPGQWTHHLSTLGIAVEGVDPVPEFIRIAQRSYPQERYRRGRAESLHVGSEALGGVLAWYSLIHTIPELIGEALAEFARCIRPGGGLALGFFTGPTLEPFDHAVATAYYWPLDLLASHVEAAGFTVTQSESRNEGQARTHGSLLAVR